MILARAKKDKKAQLTINQKNVQVNAEEIKQQTVDD
jgi:hypothetical protein